VTRLIKAKEHDLSHAVFYHQDGYSLMCPRRRLDCKNAVYIPPQGEKAANSEEGIDRKFAADFLLGGLVQLERSGSCIQPRFQSELW